ncbi:hypothetical protein D3C85_406360 [compost metagenome]
MQKRGTDLLSPLPATTGFAPTAIHFLFARAKEKARPASGFRCAQLDSLRSPFGPACGCYSASLRFLAPALFRGSSRWAIPGLGGPAHRSSFGIHAKRPSTQHLRYSLRSPYGPAGSFLVYRQSGIQPGSAGNAQGRSGSSHPTHPRTGQRRATAAPCTWQ